MTFGQQAGRLGPGRGDQVEHREVRRRQIGQLDDVHVLNCDMVLWADLDQTLRPFERKTLHRVDQRGRAGVATRLGQTVDRHQRGVHAVGVEQVRRLAIAGLDLLHQPVVDGVVRRCVVVEDAAGLALHLVRHRPEDRCHRLVVEVGRTHAHAVQHAQFLGRLEHRHEPAASPGHDPRIRAAVGDLLHVGREVTGVQRRKDVVGHERPAELGAGVTGRSRAAVAEAVVRRDLDERVVLRGQVLAQVDEVLVVLTADPEGVIVEVHAGDVVGRRRRRDQHHVVLLGDLLQAGRAAGTDRSDQHIDLILLDQLTRQGCRLVGAALVVAHQHLDLAITKRSGVGVCVKAVGQVFHAQQEGTLRHGAIDRQPARQVGDETDLDRLFAGQAAQIWHSHGCGARGVFHSRVTEAANRQIAAAVGHTLGQQAGRLGPGRGDQVEHREVRRRQIGQLDDVHVLNCDMVLWADLDQTLRPFERKTLHRVDQRGRAGVATRLGQTVDRHQRGVHAVGVEQVRRLAIAGLDLLHQPVVDGVVRRCVVVEDAAGLALHLVRHRPEDRCHRLVVEVGRTHAHAVQHAQFLGRLEHRHEPAASPGHDPRIRAAVGDLLHVGREVTGVQRRKDVVGHERPAELGAGVTGRSRAAVAEAVVRRDLDERVVLRGQVLAQVDEVLVVLTADPEGVIVEVHAGDVVGRRRRRDQHHVVLLGDLLQAGRAAGTDRSDQHIDLILLDQLTRQGCRLVGAALVVAHQHLHFAVAELVRPGVVAHLFAGCTGGVLHAQQERTLRHGAVDRQPARQVGDEADLDRCVTGECTHGLGRGFSSRRFGRRGRFGSRRLGNRGRFRRGGRRRFGSGSRLGR